MTKPLTHKQAVEPYLDRCLLLLRSKIRERGYTQLEVQECLGWGRSYLSQLLTKKKTLRFNQILYVLNAIGVDSEEFFQELFGLLPLGPQRISPSALPPAGEPELREMWQILSRLTRLLMRNGVFTAAELDGATRDSVASRKLREIAPSLFEESAAR